MKYVTLSLYLAVLVFGTVSSSPSEAADVQEIIAETQRMSGAPRTTDLVWWIPTEFWRASLANDPSATPELLASFDTTLRPYLMFAVVHGKVGPFGGVNWTSKGKLLPTINMTGTNGTAYQPLETSKLSPDVKNLSQSLLPVLANMLGPMGENMHFVFFAATSSSGENLADPLSPGEFSFDMMNRT